MQTGYILPRGITIPESKLVRNLGADMSNEVSFPLYIIKFAIKWVDP